MTHNAILIYMQNRLLGSNEDAIRILGRKALHAQQKHISYLFSEETTKTLMALSEKKTNIALKTYDDFELDSIVSKFKFADLDFILIKITNVPVTAMKRRPNHQTTLLDDITNAHLTEMFSKIGMLETSRSKTKVLEAQNSVFNYSMDVYKIINIATKSNLKSAVMEQTLGYIRDFLDEIVKDNPITDNVELNGKNVAGSCSYYHPDALKEAIYAIIAYFEKRGERIYIRINSQLEFNEVIISNYKYTPAEEPDKIMLPNEDMAQHYTFMKLASKAGIQLVKNSYPKQKGEGFSFILPTQLDAKLCETHIDDLFF